MKVILLTLWSSRKEIMLLALVLGIGSIASGPIMLFIEAYTLHHSNVNDEALDGFLRSAPKSEYVT